MRLEEFRRLVGALAGDVLDPIVLNDALNDSLESADEIISGRGSSMGLDSCYLDLTIDRDIYPLPETYARVVHVERLDGLTPWPLSPATPTEIGQAEQRNARGGFYAIVGESIRISPPPSEDAGKGLRVWGYPTHRIDPEGAEDQEVTFPTVPGAQAYVKWSTVLSVASGQQMQRAMMQLQRAEVTFRKHVEIPHADVPPRVKKEAP